MSGEVIELRDEGAIVWLRLARPGAANAISLDVATGIRDTVRSLIAAGSCRVLVIHGDGRFFSAGGDIAEMSSQTDPREHLLELASTMHEAVELLAGSGILLVSAIEGVAAGAGFSIALNSDVVIADPAARFLVAYTSAGLTPDTGMSALLPRVVGELRARELLFLGRRLDASTARDWGVVTEVVAEGGVLDRAAEVAAQLAAGPHPAFAETKRLLAAGRRSGYAEHLRDEAETISRMVGTPEARDRIRAVLDKSTRKERSTP